MCYDRGVINLADGLSSVMQLVCWSWLDPGVPGMGQPLASPQKDPCSLPTDKIWTSNTHVYKKSGKKDYKISLLIVHWHSKVFNNISQQQ